MESEYERLRTMLGAQDIRGSCLGELSSSYETREKDDRKIADVAIEKTSQYTLQIGQIAPEGELFCPLNALTKYPYANIVSYHRDSIANAFFAKGNFYKQPWDFFYIYPPSATGSKAIILVPLQQFRRFLAIVSKSFGIELDLPENAVEIGLVVGFPKDGTPVPRYLGYTANPETASGLRQAIPSASWKLNGEMESQCEPSDNSFDAFRKKLELLSYNEKKRKKAAIREKKKLERIAKQQAWNHLIKRVQRYLGIRATRHRKDESFNAPNHSIKRDCIAWYKASHTMEINSPYVGNTGILDIENPVLFDPEDSVIFISVDVESFERDHSLITEIGIATLDMAEVSTISPGEGGINWMNAIRARHFRVEEYKHLSNQEFIHGCADHFEFGQSEWISIKTAAYDISKCFEFPYSNSKASYSLGEEKSPNASEMDIKRNIILVGHDISTDINYLRKLGYDPYNLANLRELVDTSSMYRALEREPNPRNLGSILANLNIPGWYLHNAGNDAVYTLWAMIAIAIKAMVKKPEQQPWTVETKAHIAKSTKDAMEKAFVAQEGWSSDGGDGGSPVAPHNQLSLKGFSTRQEPNLNSP